MYITEALDDIKETLAQQRLIGMRKNPPLESLKKIALSKKLTSSYLIGVLCEEDFKELLDEYLSKVLVSG